MLIVQNLDFDLASTMEVMIKNVVPVVVLAPLAEEKSEYIFGIIRDPIPGQVKAPGTRRIKEPYIFVSGKRVSTARAQRWSGR